MERFAEPRAVGNTGMIGPIFGAVGFLWGYWIAVKQAGKPLDRLQYGVVFAIVFTLFGTLLGIALGRFFGLR